jgi:hypothetical protein
MSSPSHEMPLLRCSDWYSRAALLTESSFWHTYLCLLNEHNNRDQCHSWLREYIHSGYRELSLGFLCHSGTKGLGDCSEATVIIREFFEPAIANFSRDGLPQWWTIESSCILKLLHTTFSNLFDTYNVKRGERMLLLCVIIIRQVGF